MLLPSKHNAIGSQGFEAKMRVMMELRPDPVRHDIRHLCIVKGNYLSEEYKHDTEKESADAERIALMHALREEGKTLQEIADTIGVSVSTVHRHLQKIS